VLISSLSGQGILELNPYIPVIGTAIIESINLLISCNTSLNSNLLSGLIINESAGYNALIFSPSLTTALIPHLGYHKAAEIASLMKTNKIDIFEANRILRIMDDSNLKTILGAGKLLCTGFTLDDLIS
jgi:aspartate ammonia-lyase